MSMTVHYKHVSPWLLTLLAEQPELVEPFTVISRTWEPGAPDQTTIREDSIVGLPNRLKKKRLDEIELCNETVEDMREQIKNLSPKNARRILDEAKPDGFSLGKYFENVQFHISGEIADHGTSLLSRAVTGGENIGNETWPYGPATFLGMEDVEKVASRLLKISDNEFLTKYSPDDWDKQTTEYALVYFKEFVSYYTEAAKAGHAMLVWGA